MATSREERMASRLRGAGRHQVEDVSFGFVLPAPEEPPAEIHPEKPQPSEPAAAAPRSTPNTSAKRRRITDDKDSSDPRTARQPRSAAVTVSSARRDVYEIPDHTSEEGASGPAAAPRSAKRASALRRFVAGVQGDEVPDEESQQDDREEEEEDIESLPGPTSTPALAPAQMFSSRRASARGASSSQPVTEEVVGESPVDAPGSGRRGFEVRNSDAAEASSALLQRAVRLQEQEGDGGDEDEMTVGQLGQASSPLTRRSRAVREKTWPDRAGRGGRGSGGSSSAGRRSVRVSTGGGDDAQQVDELSPANTKRVTRLSAENEVDELSPANSRRVTRLSIESRIDELSPATARRGTTKRPRESAQDDLDELSPENRKRTARVSTGGTPGEADELLAGEARKSPQVPKKKGRGKGKAAIEPSRSEKEPKEPKEPKKKGSGAAKGVTGTAPAEAAQEIDDQEAARTLSRKRPRRSTANKPPEPDPRPPEAEPAARKRRRKQTHGSPAVQRQPKTRETGSQTTKKPAKRQPKTGARAATQAVDELDDEASATGTVPVTVQRFTRRVRYDADSDGDEAGADVLAADPIPFANRAGVNPVDVLAEVCEALVDSFLSSLETRAREAGDGPARREFRTMMRALEAFRDELRTRLLEQTIALDTLHALRKRVRLAQREKLALRDEILRIRAEREQVALRMDAVRIKHEADSKEAMRNINLSSAMHDVDLAADAGRTAAPLSAAEEKKAQVANLELLVGSVAELACPGDGGGALGQMKEFNGFLERVAAALEKR